MALSQEGYPNPKDYKDKEKLILDYTQKVGETEAIKKVIDFLSGQKSTVDNILKKANEKEGFKL